MVSDQSWLLLQGFTRPSPSSIKSEGSLSVFMSSQPEAIFTSTINQLESNLLVLNPRSKSYPNSNQDHPKPRLPDPIVPANSLHATLQTVKIQQTSCLTSDFQIWD
ncbi:hypothetical protein TNCV_3967781 [Trichonephila clavipes]|nr:hypothetical protein TNCV_3967781 [Trichonephila clavipes]